MLSLVKIGVFGLFLLITNPLGEKDVPFTSKFHQNDYKLKLEWAELVRFDKYYMKKASAHVFNHTRSCAAINFTFEYNVEIGYEMEGVVYEVCNFSPDEKTFPPFIPSGRYRAELQGLYRSNEMWLENVYLEVYRPFAKK